MARIRTIKPEFWESEKAGRMSPLARLTFLGLISLADDAGRGRADIGFLSGRLHPYSPEIDARMVSESLQEIENVGLVMLYSGSDGCSFYHLPGFLDNQRIDKPTPSKLPPPSKKSSKSPPRVLQESSKNVLGSIGEEGKGREGKVSIAATPLKKELTPLQKVIRGFKEAKGVDSENKDWDRKFFSRYTRPAQDLLVAFDGDANKAIVYILTKGEEWKHLPDWGLEAVVKAAGREYLRIGGTEYGSERKPVESIRVDGPRSNRLYSPSGSLAGDALRAIEHSSVRPEGDGDLGSNDDDFASDED